MTGIIAAQALVPDAEPGSPPPFKIDLSIIVVSWNTRALLNDCLGSLFSGGTQGILSVEIYVVDNASEDDSVDMVRRKFPDVQIIQNSENMGFARANNIAMARSTARYCLLLNPDTIVPKGALAALIDVMDAHPEAAVCSPLLLNGDGSPQFCWARFPCLRDEIMGKSDRSQSPYALTEFKSPESRVRMRPFLADWVGGACYMVRAGAVATAGIERLDEAFFMYGEETDWCRRFRDAGMATLLVPSVCVTHLGGQSSKRVPAETRSRIYRSSLRLYRLLYGPILALPVSAVATARYILSALIPRRSRSAG